jgi:hypothetical protein
VGLTGEVFSDDGAHDPTPAPALPVLSAAALGEHMVSVQVGTEMFDSALWSFHEQHVLTHTFAEADVPAPLQEVLTVDFYKVLMPELYAAYAGQNLALTIAAADAPTVTMAAAGGGDIALLANVSLMFTVANGASRPVVAYSLWCPFEATVDMRINGTRIEGSVGQVDVVLHIGDTPFGGLAAALASALSIPINYLLNNIAVPLLNDFLRTGVALPSLTKSLGDYGTLHAEFVRPELTIGDGFLVVGSDANITISPTWD